MAVAGETAFAQAAIDHLLTRDRWAYLYAFSSSENGCVSSSYEVFAIKSMIRYVTDFTEFVPVVRAQTFSYNYCTGVLTFASGQDDAPVIDIKPDLSRATSTAVVVMRDEFGNQQMAQINLAWSGGEISSDKTKTVFTSPYSRTMIRSDGSVRYSDSVSGSLKVDGVERLAIPGAGSIGFVASGKGSVIDVVRTPRP
jgi:hypothetical protein